EAHLVRWHLHALAQWGEQHLLGVDEALPAVVRQLVLVGHRERPGRAGLDAEPAEDAAQIVDLVDAAVPLARGEALLLGVGGPLHEDRISRAGPGAQLAADALLQTVRPPVELVAPVEPGSGRNLHLRVLDRLHLAEELVEGDAEPLDGIQEASEAHSGPPS